MAYKKGKEMNEKRVLKSIKTNMRGWESEKIEIEEEKGWGKEEGGEKE